LANQAMRLSNARYIKRVVLSCIRYWYWVRSDKLRYQNF